jgi:hypothetical protein
VQAQTAVAVAAVMRPGIRIDYNPDRPWYDRWHSVREHVATLETEYKSETIAATTHEAGLRELLYKLLSLVRLAVGG